MNTHPEWKASDPLSPALWADFAGFLTTEKVPYTAAEMAGERPLLDRALRRELARRLAGDTAAVRIALQGDPVFQKGLEVLKRSRSPREVFAAATGVAMPRRAAAPTREPATVR